MTKNWSRDLSISSTSIDIMIYQRLLWSLWMTCEYAAPQHPLTSINIHQLPGFWFWRRPTMNVSQHWLSFADFILPLSDSQGRRVPQPLGPWAWGLADGTSLRYFEKKGKHNLNWGFSRVVRQLGLRNGDISRIDVCELYETVWLCSKFL